MQLVGTTDRCGPSSAAGATAGSTAPRTSGRPTAPPSARRCPTEQPGGWALVHERWPDLATRELIMRNYLGGPERAAYDRPSAARAAPVAARPDRGEGRGAPVPLGPRRTPDVPGRAAHRQRRGRPPAGDRRARPGAAAVDDFGGAPRRGGGGDRRTVRAVRHRRRGGRRPRRQSTVDAHCGAAERALLREPARQIRTRWFTRFWAAKEAVAKAARHRPARRTPRLRGRRGRAGRLTVRVAGRDHRVCCARDRANPPGAAGAPLRRRLDTRRRPQGDNAANEHRPTTASPVTRRGAPCSPTSPQCCASCWRSTASTTLRSPWTTTFHDDLELESIDLVALAGQLREHYGEPRQLRDVHRRARPRRDHRADRRRARPSTSSRPCRRERREPDPHRRAGRARPAAHPATRRSTGTRRSWCASTACSPTAWPATTSRSARPSRHAGSRC